MEKLLEWVSKVNLFVAAIITMCMAIIGALDIITTNVIGKAIPGAFELSQIGLALLIFLGLASASRHHEFIGVDILVNRLSRRGQMFCGAFGWLSTSVFFSFWTWQMWYLMIKSIAVNERANGLLPFPIYPAKVLIFLAMIIATVETLRRTYIYLKQAVSGNFTANGEGET